MSLIQFYNAHPLLFWVGGIVIAIIITIAGILWGPELYNYFRGNTGVKISPLEISYNCGNFGIIKTITLTNYDKEPKTNFVLTITSPSNKNLEISMKDVDNSIRSEITSMRLSNSNKTENYDVFIISNIKPASSIQFDFSFLSKCEGNFTIYTNKDNPITVTNQIFSKS